MITFAAILLSVSLSIAPASGSAARIAASHAPSGDADAVAGEGDADARLDVKATHAKGFAEHSDLVRDTLETKGRERVAGAAIGAAWSVHVAVDVRKVGVYALEIYSEKDGRRLESAVVKDTCEQCLMDDLVAQMQTGIDAQLDAIRRADAESNASDPAGTTPADPNGTATTPGDGERGGVVPDEPTRRPLRGMGKAGIALLAIGAVGLGVGIGLAVRGKKVDQGAELDTVDLGPPGYAVLAIGAASLVTGAVLLGVDRTRAQRRVQALAPVLTPRMMGLVVTGRF